MDPDESTPRKSKKPKSKRPKPAPSDDGSSSNELVIVDESCPIKAQPKLPLNKMPVTTPTTSTNNKKRKKRDSASSDEERWLTAIESGKLEDVDDELKKIKSKDPALMTARQRAMYDRGTEGNPSTPTLMSLPTGYKEKVMTAEAIQKAAIKSLKRKQLADEKREKDKKKTMERLLKKQDSKAGKQTKQKTTRTNAPLIIYRQNNDITMLSLPEGVDFPLKASIAPEPKKPELCGMNCGNFKKYNCSRTGVPLCSLECYKNNISNRIL
ncbi:INO80 complex subunit B [Sitophilus oryzae]|uniref:INO80 complex subunit B n=1 Tax=Sitophilus oryzae TaxID=7048 RepID=A0A6J2YF54_SITOR|nr:INO80 complex subunit B [Sitophilus oryzae]